MQILNFLQICMYFISTRCLHTVTGVSGNKTSSLKSKLPLSFVFTCKQIFIYYCLS